MEMKIKYVIIWLVFFLIVGIIIVGIGSNYEEASYKGMVMMYIIGFLLGTVVSQYISQKHRGDKLITK